MKNFHFFKFVFSNSRKIKTKSIKLFLINNANFFKIFCFLNIYFKKNDIKKKE